MTHTRDTGEQDSVQESLRWLSEGEMEIVGQVVDSWNQVFVVRVRQSAREGLAIYKPRSGEHPLWDFPEGTLCVRERASYLVSRFLDWPLIPPTVLRDGPLGLGMVQQFIEADPEVTYFQLREERIDALLPVALFDLLVNNADRKGGHLLLEKDGRIWAIDQALTFHTEYKLRTVIWDFVNRPIPPVLLKDVARLRRALEPGGGLEAPLAALLSEMEIDALRERASHLLHTPVFPSPDPRRRHLPWPLI
jgi:hypothetical protein